MICKNLYKTRWFLFLTSSVVRCEIITSIQYLWKKKNNNKMIRKKIVITFHHIWWWIMYLCTENNNEMKILKSFLMIKCIKMRFGDFFFSQQTRTEMSRIQNQYLTTNHRLELWFFFPRNLFIFKYVEIENLATIRKTRTTNKLFIYKQKKKKKWNKTLFLYLSKSHLY